MENKINENNTNELDNIVDEIESLSMSAISKIEKNKNKQDTNPVVEAMIKSLQELLDNKKNKYDLSNTEDAKKYRDDLQNSINLIFPENLTSKEEVSPEESAEEKKVDELADSTTIKIEENTNNIIQDVKKQATELGVNNPSALSEINNKTGIFLDKVAIKSEDSQEEIKRIKDRKIKINDRGVSDIPVHINEKKQLINNLILKIEKQSNIVNEKQKKFIEQELLKVKINPDFLKDSNFTHSDVDKINKIHIKLARINDEIKSNNNRKKTKELSSFDISADSTKEDEKDVVLNSNSEPIETSTDIAKEENKKMSDEEIHQQEAIVQKTKINELISELENLSKNSDQATADKINSKIEITRKNSILNKKEFKKYQETGELVELRKNLEEFRNSLNKKEIDTKGNKKIKELNKEQVKEPKEKHEKISLEDSVKRRKSAIDNWIKKIESLLEKATETDKGKIIEEINKIKNNESFSKKDNFVDADAETLAVLLGGLPAKYNELNRGTNKRVDTSFDKKIESINNFDKLLEYLRTLDFVKKDNGEQVASSEVVAIIKENRKNKSRGYNEKINRELGKKIAELLENDSLVKEEIFTGTNEIKNKEEAPQSEKVEDAKNSKDTFFNVLNAELSAMEKAGRLTPEQAEEKRKSATLIEIGFSDDPAHDALVFSRAGIADEKELVEIFNKKNTKEKLSTPKSEQVDNGLEDISMEDAVSDLEKQGSIINLTPENELSEEDKKIFEEAREVAININSENNLNVLKNNTRLDELYIENNSLLGNLNEDIGIVVEKRKESIAIAKRILELASILSKENSGNVANVSLDDCREFLKINDQYVQLIDFFNQKNEEENEARKAAINSEYDFTEPVSVTPGTEINKEEQKQAEQVLENMPEKEKKTFFEGLANIGFKTAELKNKTLAYCFDKLADVSSGEKIEYKVSKITKNTGMVAEFFDKISQSYKKKEDQAIKDQENNKKGLLKKASGIGQGVGNLLKYGRIVVDLVGTGSSRLLNPFRHVTAAAMVAGTTLEAGKEVRLTQRSVQEKTLIDKDKAFDEARVLYKQAQNNKQDSGKITAEDLNKVYRENLPKDIIERLDNVENLGVGFVQNIVNNDAKKYIERIKKQIDKINTNAKLDEQTKKNQIESVLQKNDDLLKDLDRIVGNQAGADQLAYWLRVGEKTSKGVATAMMIDSVYRLAHVAVDMWEVFHNHPETTVDVQDKVVQKNASGAKISEKISKIEDIKKTETITGGESLKTDSEGENIENNGSKVSGSDVNNEEVPSEKNDMLPKSDAEALGEKESTVKPESLMQDENAGTKAEADAPKEVSDASIESKAVAGSGVSTEKLATEASDSKSVLPTENITPKVDGGKIVESATIPVEAVKVEERGLDRDFKIKLGKDGVPKQLERAFQMIAVDNMDIAKDATFGAEHGARSLNIAQNLIRLAEGKQDSVAGISREEFLKSIEYNPKTGELNIVNHSKFNEIVDKLDKNSIKLWENHTLKTGAAAWLDEIKPGTWSKIVHAEGMEKGLDLSDGSVSVSTGIEGHDEIDNNRIAEFEKDDIVQNANRIQEAQNKIHNLFDKQGGSNHKLELDPKTDAYDKEDLKNWKVEHTKMPLTEQQRIEIDAQNKEFIKEATEKAVIKIATAKNIENIGILPEDLSNHNLLIEKGGLTDERYEQVTKFADEHHNDVVQKIFNPDSTSLTLSSGDKDEYEKISKLSVNKILAEGGKDFGDKKVWGERSGLILEPSEELHRQKMYEALKELNSTIGPFEDGKTIKEVIDKGFKIRIINSNTALWEKAEIDSKNMSVRDAMLNGTYVDKE